MSNDVKIAVRSLLSAKSFTSVALIILTLSLGASTTIFSVVDAVVMRGLPFDEHDRLVAVGERRVPGPNPDPSRDPLAVGSASPQNYIDWAAQQQVFEAIAATTSGALTLQDPGAPPEDVPVQRVTAGFFDVLRTRPAIGGAFTTENEADGRHRVAVLSHAFWQGRFGGDPSVIGRTIPLNQQRYEIIGVMPPEFAYPVSAVRPTSIWVPYVVPQDERVRVGRRMSVYLQPIARLKPGTSIDRAQAHMDQIARALQATHPVWNQGTDIGVRPLVDHLVGARMKSWMFMLLGAVGLVLLIACANVANLVLARATVRSRELGIRAALGASRWRLMRQLMVESILLSSLGAILAIALAWWTIPIVRVSIPDNVPRVADIVLDVRVLGCALALSLATGVFLGILPALQLSRPNLTAVLKESSHTTIRGARHWTRRALVVGEVGLAVVLLTGAALFIGSFIAVMRIDPGFDPRNVLVGQIPAGIGFGGPTGAPPDVSAQLLELVGRIRQIPGVAHASIVSGGIPLAGGVSITGMTVPGQPVAGGRDQAVSFRRVTPGYHEALKIRLVTGRLFEPADRRGARAVVIVNESAARKYFAGDSPLGRTVRLEDDTDRTIVGVVGDVRQTSLETEPLAEAYVPLAQTRATSGEFVVRTTVDPYDVLPALKSAVLAVFPNVPVRTARTMEEMVARRLAPRKLNMLLLGLFGVLGLAISIVGLYGVMSQVVEQRTRDIGVRIALGARPGRVIGAVVGEAFRLLTIGVVSGAAATWYLTSAAQPFLFGWDARDPWALAGVVASLFAAGLIAAAVPARRAATVDPTVALRAE